MKRRRSNSWLRKCTFCLLILWCTALYRVFLAKSNDIQVDLWESAGDDRDDARPKFELFSLQDTEQEQDDGTVKLLTYIGSGCKGEEMKLRSTQPTPRQFSPSIIPASIKVQGSGMVEVHVEADGRYPHYRGTVVALEGCVDLDGLLGNPSSVQFTLYTAENTTMVRNRQRQVPPSIQKEFSTVDDLSKPHTRIVFSAQSSDYFGYQVYANAMGFLQSNQTNASWMRLLTAPQPDDLSERFPTFTASESLHSKSYEPINKVDIIDKWFHSADAPHPDDTIVVIDPDNWLLRDLHQWTKRVSHKHAVGQVAYYRWSGVAQKLFQEVCIEGSCDAKLDRVGVPYIVKAADLKEIAPLWRYYTIQIKEKLKDPKVKARYDGWGFEWAAEMVAYNAACATLKIKTEIVKDLQVRDVETSQDWYWWPDLPMIHMGRAWFPKNEAEVAAPWRHEEDAGFGANGIQVWCKCNRTAAKVQPWPLPKGMDFVSYHTLRLLHDSKEFFGPVPENRTFRNPDPGGHYSAA